MPGDDPPRDRTSELRQLGFPSRHLGPMQMTTDTALGVTKRVVDDEGDSCFFFLLRNWFELFIVQLNAIPYVVRRTIFTSIMSIHSLSRTSQPSHSMLKKVLKCLFVSDTPELP
jgi:hypothetical protein